MRTFYFACPSRLVEQSYCPWQFSALKFCVAHNSKSIEVRILKLDRNVNNHERMRTFYFACPSRLVERSYCPWQFSALKFCVAHNSKSIEVRILKLDRNVNNHERMRTFYFACPSWLVERSYYPWQFSALKFCVAHNSKSIKVRILKLNRNIINYKMCTFYFACPSTVG